MLRLQAGPEIARKGAKPQREETGADLSGLGKVRRHFTVQAHARRSAALDLKPET